MVMIKCRRSRDRELETTKTGKRNSQLSCPSTVQEGEKTIRLFVFHFQLFVFTYQCFFLSKTSKYAWKYVDGKKAASQLSSANGTCFVLNISSIVFGFLSVLYLSAASGPQ